MLQKNLSCLLIILVSFYLPACSNNNENTAKNNGDTSSLPAVETEKPNSNYKPAFTGETRISGVKTTTPYEIAKDKYNVLQFEPVKTTALRMEIKLPKTNATGVHEWIVK